MKKWIQAFMALSVGGLLALGLNPLLGNEWVSFPTPPPTGVLIVGDNSTAPTEWWSHILNTYEATAVFSVPPRQAVEGYHLACTVFNGESFLQKRISHDPFFQVRVGREDCRFFALDQDSLPVEITLVARSTKGDAAYAYAPLH